MRIPYGYCGELRKGEADVPDALVMSFVPTGATFKRASVDLLRKNPAQAILYVSTGPDTHPPRPPPQKNMNRPTRPIRDLDLAPRMPSHVALVAERLRTHDAGEVQSIPDSEVHARLMARALGNLVSATGQPLDQQLPDKAPAPGAHFAYRDGDFLAVTSSCSSSSRVPKPGCGSSSHRPPALLGGRHGRYADATAPAPRFRYARGPRTCYSCGRGNRDNDDTTDRSRP